MRFPETPEIFPYPVPHKPPRIPIEAQKGLGILLMPQTPIIHNPLIGVIRAEVMMNSTPAFKEPYRSAFHRAALRLDHMRTVHEQDIAIPQIIKK
jgi:hypothetical protein